MTTQFKMSESAIVMSEMCLYSISLHNKQLKTVI